MFSPKRSRLQLSPTTVIASLALFFALGGGAAVAAQQFINGSRITPHSINLKQLSPQAIAALEGKAGTSKTGASGTPGSQGATGSTGPAGPKGAAGPAGPPASASTLGEQVVVTWTSLGSNSGGTSEVDCPVGKTAIGGGGGLGLGTSGGWNGVNNYILEGSSPRVLNGSNQAIGWSIEAVNELPNSISFPVYAICVNG